MREKIRHAGMLTGVGCAVIPIILTSVLSLGKVAMKNAWSYILCGVAMLVSACTDISNIWIIVVAIALGMFKTAYLKMRGNHYGIN